MVFPNSIGTDTRGNVYVGEVDNGKRGNAGNAGETRDRLAKGAVQIVPELSKTRT